MPELFCVRANYGQYAEQFIKGGYVAIGWFEEDLLSSITNRVKLEEMYKQKHPEDKSQYVIGQQVGQIARFLFEMKPGDYVITPASETEYLYWGKLKDEPVKHVKPDDGCPFANRRSVEWSKIKLQRNQFSVPFQNTIRSSLTVFYISHKNEFFEIIGKKDLASPEEIKVHEDATEVALNRILELDANEFEILVTELLNALGFEAHHTGKVGDGGVDATGELDLYGVAKIKLYVQAKRYQLGSKINAGAVKTLRQNIHSGAQGAFITTAKFQKNALEAAIEPGFPRIGAIDGEQLVDLLSEKWEELNLPPELKQKLGLKRGLIVE